MMNQHQSHDTNQFVVVHFLSLKWLPQEQTWDQWFFECITLKLEKVFAGISKVKSSVFSSIAYAQLAQQEPWHMLSHSLSYPYAFAHYNVIFQWPLHGQCFKCLITDLKTLVSCNFYNAVSLVMLRKSEHALGRRHARCTSWQRLWSNQESEHWYLWSMALSSNYCISMKNYSNFTEFRQDWLKTHVLHVTTPPLSHWIKKAWRYLKL